MFDRSPAESSDCLHGGEPRLTSKMAGDGELATAVGMDGRCSAFEHGVRGDVADGAVQAARVVVDDEDADDAAGIVQRQRRLAADGLGLEGLVEALLLAVGLGIVG